MQLILDVLYKNGDSYAEYKGVVYNLPPVQDDIADLKIAYFKKITEGYPTFQWPDSRTVYAAFEDGYRASPKKYTEDDLRRAFEFGSLVKFNSPLIKRADLSEKFNAFLQTVAPKPKQVEVEMDKKWEDESLSSHNFNYDLVPVVDEKGFVKVIRWIY